MRIDANTRGQEVEDGGQTAASGARGSAAAQNESASATDTAQLSADQVRVQSLVAQASALPEIRQAKVDALGRAIREGGYQVSADQTAAAMLAEYSREPVAA